MRRVKKVLLLTIPLLGLTACGGLDNPSNEEVKGGELVVNFPASVMKETLLAKGVISKEQKVFGYKAYKIPYTTRDEEGHEVEVSGLFVIPPMLGKQVAPLGGLSMVSDDHGTIFANREAPSVVGDLTGSPDGSAVILTSLGGFATLQPDYIGFGDSQSHYHPFILKDSLANATIDFIRAVKVFAKENKIMLNNQLFLTGYSEGGYAAMATLKKIEEEGLSDLNVTLAAPMSGPYALKSMADAVLTQPKLSVPSFMAEIGYAYAKAKGEEVSSVVNEPYASQLSTLFNGDFNRTEIDPKLTYKTTGDDGLFVGSFVKEYFSKDGNWFREAMSENSLHAWTPKTPLQLIHCQGDDVIPFAISKLTAGTMQKMGAENVSVIPVEAVLGLDYNVTHSSCGSLAYTVTTKIFSTMRQQTKGY